MVAPPQSEATTTPSTQQQDITSNRTMMPRLVHKAPGWFTANYGATNIGEDGERGLQQQQCGGDGGDGGDGCEGVPLHRRKALRTRAAPLGPHPYLDRFASGMHRPLEGGECSWRNASIQPVPIPDLTHTGIRTKFSPGLGDGFTPDGAMTEIFRTGIHETIRNLPHSGVTSTLGDTRDMRTRDYARAVRRHRADPCGGSLIHAHMSSIELLGGGVGPRSSSSTPGGGAGPGFPLGGGGSPALLRGSSSLRSFRSRFVVSPPSSPLLSARRGDSGAGGFEGRDCGTPAEGREALLQRELRSVKLAAAAVAVGRHKRGGGEHGQKRTPVGAAQDALVAGRGVSGAATTSRRRSRASRRGLNSSSGHHAEGPMGATNAQHHRAASSPSEARHREVGFVSNPTTTTAASQRKHCSSRNQSADWEGFDAVGDVVEGGGGGGGGRGAGRQGKGDDEEFVFQHPRNRSSSISRRRGSRGRRRRRFPPLSEGVLLAASSPASTTINTAVSRSRTRGHRSPPAGKSARRCRRRRRKKPFSADSLFACLLDVRYGNTRDLSPDKRPTQKWDLTGLPTGITAAAEGAWDGLGPAEEEEAVDGQGYAEVEDAAPSEGAQRLFSNNNNDEDDDGRDDFIIVHGGEAGTGTVIPTERDATTGR